MESHHCVSAYCSNRHSAVKSASCVRKHPGVVLSIEAFKPDVCEPRALWSGRLVAFLDGEMPHGLSYA